MRCPSCGTANALDSRFCGGCGARLVTSDQRVAPTQKISDDASFPQRPLAPTAAPITAAGAAPGTAPITAPGVAMPRAIPATPYVAHGAGVYPAPQRPLGSVAPARPNTAPVALRSAPARPARVASEAFPATGGAGRRDPRASPSRADTPFDDPSLSLPMPARRPWGLIVVVLVIDVGLAVSGAWMLHQGLGKSGAAAPPPSARAP